MVYISFSFYDLKYSYSDIRIINKFQLLPLVQYHFSSSRNLYIRLTTIQYLYNTELCTWQGDECFSVYTMHKPAWQVSDI